MYMTAIFLGSGNDGFQTGIGCECDTTKETLSYFESLRKQSEDISTAAFIIDLKNQDGEILDSIGVSADTYSTVSGQPAFSEAVYRQIDADIWAEARKSCAV